MQSLKVCAYDALAVPGDFAASVTVPNLYLAKSLVEIISIWTRQDDFASYIEAFPSTISTLLEWPVSEVIVAIARLRPALRGFIDLSWLDHLPVDKAAILPRLAGPAEYWPSACKSEEELLDMGRAWRLYSEAFGVVMGASLADPVATGWGTIEVHVHVPPNFCEDQALIRRQERLVHDLVQAADPRLVGFFSLRYRPKTRAA